MKMKRILTAVLVAVLGNCLPADAVEPAVPIKARPFSLNQVRLLDSPFKKAMEINKAYLLKLDADRMLWPFHERAGLPAKGQRYGGWAQKDCVGHEAGHYLSACALMYASTGDEESKKRVDYMVSELAKVQAKHGDGYAGSVRPEVWKKTFSGAIGAKDYAKAGRMYDGIPAEKVKQILGQADRVQIVSLGEPAPHARPETQFLCVPFEVEIETGGTKSTKKGTAYVRPVYNHPDHWTISDGI